MILSNSYYNAYDVKRKGKKEKMMKKKKKKKKERKKERKGINEVG
jgi:hypothetical protein